MNHQPCRKLQQCNPNNRFYACHGKKISRCTTKLTVMISINLTISLISQTQHMVNIAFVHISTTLITMWILLKCGRKQCTVTTRPPCSKIIFRANRIRSATVRNKLAAVWCGWITDSTLSLSFMWFFISLQFAILIWVYYKWVGAPEHWSQYHLYVKISVRDSNKTHSHIQHILVSIEYSKDNCQFESSLKLGGFPFLV